MEKIARRTIKILLFLSLFLLAGRYVHTYPLPMTLRQQHYLSMISDLFGVDDYEFFYIISMIIIDLIVTIIVYSLLIRLWRRYRTKH